MIYVVKSLPIFKLFSCFLIVDFWVLLYIFGTKLFCQMIYRYILPVCGLCFHFPNSVICRAKVLNFGKVQLISFSFIILYLSSLTNSRSWRFSPSKSFQVLFYISIFDPFWVNYIIDFASGGQSIRTSASACPSNEYSGLSSFRINWFDPLAVQVTLKSLL